MAVNLKDVIGKFENLSSQRTWYEPRWQTINKYIAPNRKDIQYDTLPGAKKTDDLCDTAAIHAKNLLISTLTGSIASKSRRWAALNVKHERFSRQFDVKMWLHELIRIIFHHYSRSNLYRELNLLYEDLVDLGTAPLFIDTHPPLRNGSFGGLKFKAIPLKEAYIAEGRDGIVDTLFRKFRVAAIEAAQTWGLNNLTDKMRQTYEKTPYDLVTILHGVYPRDIPRTERDVLKLNTQKDYASVYIAFDEKELIHESGFDFFPFAVPRWTKYSGEVYGRGPADEALPEIETLNKYKEQGLKWDALRLEPPMVVEQGSIVGKFTLEPRAIIEKMAGISTREALFPLEMGGDLTRERIKIEDVKDQIKKAFFADQIEAFIAIEAPRRTATEVQLRYDLMQQMLGPILTNIEQELLDPIINKTIEILGINGVFPAPPSILVEEDAEITIEYESPLAKRQRVDELLALQRLYEMLGIVSPHAPDAGDGINHDEAIRIFSDISGVPPSVLRKEKELGVIRQSKIQAEQREQNIEESLALTKGLKDVTGMAKLLNGEQGRALPVG